MTRQLYMITRAQRDQLAALLAAGAREYGLARPARAIAPFSTSVVGILQRYGLVGMRKTGPTPLFYLTADGLAEARSDVVHRRG